VVTRYRLTPPNWPAGFPLKIAVIADLHACEMPAARIGRIAALANSLAPDLILLAGD
jgi:predicted MPP superfamily phosphohydrolase